MVLVYSSGEISVRKLADSLPVYVEVKSEYETAFFDEEDIPEEREKARDLYEACKSFLTSLQSKKRSDYEKEKLIHDYIVSNVAYGYPGG